MFKPCPKCGFLVALIAGREASQRCPRCGSGLVDPDEILPSPDTPAPASRRTDTGTRDAQAGADSRAPAPGPARESPGTRGEAIAPSAVVRDLEDTRGPLHPADVPGQGLQHGSGAVDDARSARAGTARTDPAAADASTRGAASIDADTAAAPAATVHRGTDAAAAPGDAAPTFVRRRDARPPTGRRWPWWVAVAGLALLLALQLLLAQYRELAADARWRPVIARLCPVFGCALPPWREPAAYAMLARNVRPHPARPDVLRASTTVRNDARWPQPLPVVVLSLSDVDGRIVGTRAVPPRDYSRTPRALVTPGTSVDIAFEVREPAGRVVSFDFRLQ